MNTFLHVFILGFAVCEGPLCVQSQNTRTVKEGSTAVLPCNLRTVNRRWSSRPHIEWRTFSGTVFERRGEESYEGEEYEGRVDVPEENLLSGDCSLVLKNVRLSDAGPYESYLLEKGRTKRSLNSRWVYIQTVELSVDEARESMDNMPLKLKASTNAGVTRTPTSIVALVYLLITLLHII